ncbi:hypothetical protein NEMBOFW57_006776 [Staphylotrichum longicolle]|uniref:ATPase AAA-type core domain-containing protein n=1 Tax=Staphylotrichum longicolle TaxID=669026 RepID=A0AAD4HUQ9_9PEZI|nr:hypothetical protein NEMBOFW57_006776 [Staphylotrichum longicolle]
MSVSLSGTERQVREFRLVRKKRKAPQAAAAERAEREESEDQQEEEGQDEKSASKPEDSRSNSASPVDHSDESSEENETDSRDDSDFETRWYSSCVRTPPLWKTDRRKTPLEVRVSWHNFEHFKNRYSPADSLAIIEVLRGHRDIAQEVTAEETWRKHHRGMPPREPGPNTPPADGHDWWIQRVRIQSFELINLLPRDDEALPFIEDLDRPGPMAPSAALYGFLDSAKTLSHVREYVKFVDTHIVPTWNDAPGTAKRKARFDDLWTVFKPGEVLYLKSESEYLAHSTDAFEFAKDVAISGERRFSSTIRHCAYRLYARALTPVRDCRLNDIYPQSGGDGAEKRYLLLYCYYVDFDGVSYVPVSTIIRIGQYAGERDITQFSIYPMRFVENADSTTAHLEKEGSWFCQAIQLKHLRYDGWTLPYGPCATTWFGCSEAPPQVAPAPVEHINGDIMIDFSEGFHSESLADPSPSKWSTVNHNFSNPQEGDWAVGDDECPILHWEHDETAPGKVKYLGELREKTQLSEWHCGTVPGDQLSSSRLITARSRGDLVTELDKEDVVLLPRRLIGYAFRERKFFLLDVRCLKPFPTTRDGFRDLKVDDQHKKIIKSLVKTHLREQTGSRPSSAVTPNQDLIRGKVFLRVLEYYSGILFLTTNRVGALDEAFKSRIHLSLYYPPLTLERTLAIFDVNIRKLREMDAKRNSVDMESNTHNHRGLHIDDHDIRDYARWYFENHPEDQRWNGRQIRNAFQIAYSLSHFDMEKASTDDWEDDDDDDNIDSEARGHRIRRVHED